MSGRGRRCVYGTRLINQLREANPAASGLRPAPFSMSSQLCVVSHGSARSTRPNVTGSSVFSSSTDTSEQDGGGEREEQALTRHGDSLRERCGMRV